MRRKASVSWRDVDKRMRRAVELRKQGLSLRKIADHLVVTHTTVKRDLERWEATQIDQLLEHLGGTYAADEGRMFQSNVPDPNDRRMQ
jgi:transposase